MSRFSLRITAFNIPQNVPVNLDWHLGRIYAMNVRTVFYGDIPSHQRAAYRRAVIRSK